MPTICLWDVPEADFAEWRSFVGEPRLQTYREYRMMLAAVQADCERSGLEVRRVSLRVESVRAGLACRGLPNTPECRAEVLAMSHLGE